MDKEIQKTLEEIKSFDTKIINDKYQKIESLVEILADTSKELLTLIENLQPKIM